jgi:hypothetical protein
MRSPELHNPGWRLQAVYRPLIYGGAIGPRAVFEKVATQSKRSERNLWLACIGASITLGLLAGTLVALFLR